jgi:hypothetical protein
MGYVFISLCNYDLQFYCDNSNIEVFMTFTALLVTINGEETIAEHWMCGKLIYPNPCNITNIETYLGNLNLLKDGLFLENPCRWTEIAEKTNEKNEDNNS